jgi:hypothetical protein
MASIGIITGLVGMFTGVGGFVMGFLAYRQSGKNKVLDLRLQFRRDMNALRATLEHLPGTMDAARQSRGRVLAASGLGRSGNEQIFNQAWEVDKAAVKALVARARTIEGDDFSLSGKDLELILGEVNRLILEASRYADKYHGAIASDDSRRSELRAEQTALAAARMQIPLKKKLGE